eukprot:5146050-Lingulodinium_polyedra.AAC.1
MAPPTWRAVDARRRLRSWRPTIQESLGEQEQIMTKRLSQDAARHARANLDNCTDHAATHALNLGAQQ